MNENAIDFLDQYWPEFWKYLVTARRVGDVEDTLVWYLGINGIPHDDAEELAEWANERFEREEGLA